MGSLSILQVAVSGRLVHERVRAKVEQIPAAPARLAREVALVLARAKVAVTHGVGMTEDAPRAPDADARLEQILSLETSRNAPAGDPEGDVAVVTIVALGPAPLFAPVAAGDGPGIEAALQSLGAIPDDAVTRLAVHVAPGAGETFAPSSLAEGYPHLGAITSSPAGQVRCRFCGRELDAYRTVCPGCGGVADR